MDRSLLLRKLIEKLVDELKSSNHYPSDADWHTGFNSDTPVEESEIDPKTGKIVHNTSVGDHATFLQQWDTSSGGFLEGEERDSGTYSFKLNNLFRAYAKKTDE